MLKMLPQESIYMMKASAIWILFLFSPTVVKAWAPGPALLFTKADKHTFTIEGPIAKKLSAYLAKKKDVFFGKNLSCAQADKRWSCQSTINDLGNDLSPHVFFAEVVDKKFSRGELLLKGKKALLLFRGPVSTYLEKQNSKSQFFTCQGDGKATCCATEIDRSGKMQNPKKALLEKTEKWATQCPKKKG